MDISKLTDTEKLDLLKSKKIGVVDFVDSGVCPTCFDRVYNGAIYGDNTDKMIYENDLFSAFLVGNPRANGHVAITSKKHYKDMMDIDDVLCSKIFIFAKDLMNIIKKVYASESVYLCTMCDGLMNHFHLQLIPRYSFENRGSKNFVKTRFEYVEDKEKLEEIRHLIKEKYN